MSTPFHQYPGSPAWRPSQTTPDCGGADPAAESVENWFELGNTSCRNKDYPRAIACYQKARALEPDVPELHFNLGNTYLELGDIAAAIACFHEAVNLAPDYAEAHFNLGIAYYERKSLEQAIEYYRKAADLRPDMVEAFYNLGLALQECGRLSEAIECYRRVTAIQPDFAEAHNNLGIVLQENGEFDAAGDAYRQAICHRADYADAYYNLGSIRHLQHRLSEAIDYYRKTLVIRADHHKASNNMAKAFQDQRQIDAAIGWYKKALNIKPDYAEARFNLATAQLLKGDFEEGWKNYEFRFKKSDWKRIYPRRFREPRWNGEPFEGKRLYVHSEQGLGDMLQFARYLPMAKARGGQVVFETRQALIELFRGIDGVDQVVPLTLDADPAVDFDVFVPLLSLPGIFATTLASIPNKVPYLKADPGKSSAWGRRLAGDGLRVGLVWAGTATDPHRASPLAWFAPLSTIGGIRIYGLQKGPAADLLETEGLPQGMRMENIGREFEDFGDTAAAIENLDLVVSIDTSVAHLAGAMGKPVYLLLPNVPDWRWMLDREDSPWYPTMRLYRQEKPGDWGPPLTRVARRVDMLARSLQLAISETGVSGLMAAATHFQKQGDWIEALLFYNHLLRVHPDHPEGLHGIGMVAYQMGNHAHAIGLFERAVVLAPETDRYHYHLGLAHAALKQYETAAEAFHRACCINPACTDAHANLQWVLGCLRVPVPH